MNKKKQKTEKTKIETQDREIFVGENQLYLGEDNIIYVIRVGEADEEIATDITNTGLKLADLVNGKVKILADLNKAGKSSSDARKIYQKHLKHNKFDKVALYGLHPVARVIATFGMGITKKKDVRFFKTKEEALLWLKE